MTVRIDFPFSARFEFQDPGNNSRELRTIALQSFLGTSGMDLDHDLESFEVTRFDGEEDGEFWHVKTI